MAASADDWSVTFQQALVAGDVSALQKCPKSDLHNHAFAGGERKFVKQRTGHDIQPLQKPLQSMDEMHAWIDKNFGDVFEGSAGRLLAFEATMVQAKKDGVTRLDVGEDVWAATIFDGSVRLLTQERAAVHQRVAPQIEWIRQLGISRHCPVDSIIKWMEPFLELNCYDTIDLYGDELAQPIEVFQPIYRTAQAHGIRLKAHVGEWGAADDVWRAVELLELNEVQHGIAAASSPAVMRFLAENEITLNICPTSNVMLGRVEDLKSHPIRQLFDAGVRVTISSDDVLVFGQSVSDEYLNLFSAGVLSAEELDGIRGYGLMVNG